MGIEDERDFIMSAYYGKEVSKKLDTVIANQEKMMAGQGGGKVQVVKSGAVDDKFQKQLDTSIEDLIKKKVIPNRLGQGLLRGNIKTLRQFIGTKIGKMQKIPRFGDLCIEQAHEVLEKMNRRAKTSIEFGDKL